MANESSAATTEPPVLCRKYRHGGARFYTVEDEARARMEQVRREAEKAVADACTCGGIDAVPHATDHDPLCSVHGIEGWRDA